MNLYFSILDFQMRFPFNLSVKGMRAFSQSLKKTSSGVLLTKS